jgi:hypothetical protein
MTKMCPKYGIIIHTNVVAHNDKYYSPTGLKDQNWEGHKKNFDKKHRLWHRKYKIKKGKIWQIK